MKDSSNGEEFDLRPTTHDSWVCLLDSLPPVEISDARKSGSDIADYSGNRTERTLVGKKTSPGPCSMQEKTLLINEAIVWNNHSPDWVKSLW
jgi:hypothetical protein